MMKQTRHYRRILAAILAVVLTVGMSLTAFATSEDHTAGGTGSSETDKGTGSITITNPKQGVEYNAYKIFDVAYTPVVDKTSYSYTIDSGSEWFETVKSYADKPENKLILSQTAGKTEDDKGIYVVSTDKGFSAANFAKALQAAVEGKTPQATKALAADAAAGATLELGSELPLGYYLIMGTNAGLCSLDTTDPDADVTDKNDVPFDKDLTGVDGDPIPPTDSHGVTVGSVLTYTIDGTVPDTEGFADYVYIAEDTMGAGLTMNEDSVELYINGVKIETLTSDKTGTIPTTEAGKLNPVKNTVYYKTGGRGFVLRLNMMDYAADKEKPLAITYTATVNENAVQVISKNEAKLSYGNDPDNLTDGEPSVVRVFSSNIEVLKYMSAGTPDDLTSRLAGAEFVLKNSTGEGESVAPGDKYYKATIVTGDDGEKVTNVTWVDSIDEATHVTTDDGTTDPNKKGLAYFKGLENGTYYLVETKAPTGYNLLGSHDATPDGKIAANGEVRVVVDTTITLDEESGEWVGVPADFTTHENVANSKGSFLPSTGGIGTTIFYVLGSVLLVVAAAWFVISRRKAQTEEK